MSSFKQIRQNYDILCGNSHKNDLALIVPSSHKHHSIDDRTINKYSYVTFK